MTIVTVFRSRPRPGVESAYEPVSHEMSRIVASMEGFTDQKSYVAQDGERVTLVRFSDRHCQRRWTQHPDHLAAQDRGRQEFYSWYDIPVGEETYGRAYEGPSG